MCEINYDEPFGTLIALQNGVVFRLVKQDMAVHDHIVKAISESEVRPICTRRDIANMEGEAKILLTLKEVAMSSSSSKSYAMSCSSSKSYYDHDFSDCSPGHP